MISVQQATTILLSHLYKPGIIKLALNNSVNKILAEHIYADRDFPPFDRVTMDGVAIHFESWKKGQRKFSIETVQAAGEARKKLQHQANAIEVMTGAMLPAGTDTVIRYEDIKIEGSEVIIEAGQIMAWQSVHRQGQDAKAGEILLVPGMVLSPAEIALLASVGKTKVDVFTYPKTAIVSSGDELVGVSASPLPHQIRRSNTYAIEAAMHTLHWEGKQFHMPDEKQTLKKNLEEILQEYDAIILSGGVSQGKFDFVPAVMEEIGVQKIFHQVSQRPGKPFWFGVSRDGKAVFALPGNPVSTFMCFYRYIRPWLLKSLGVEIRLEEAILAKDFSFPPKLTYFLQVTVKNEGGRRMAYPDAGGGSGDFTNLKKIDGFLELPAERTEFKAGEVFPYIAFRG
jgi:molybdopterin molybdotransferase